MPLEFKLSRRDLMTKLQFLIQKNFSNQMVIACHEKTDEVDTSIIIPTFNCLEYLPKAIQSIQKQNVSSVEIIILDDGSTDKTWQYLLLIAQCDLRIKPIKLNGVGVSKARNLGLKHAKGKYVAFLDADDYWLTGKLKRQLAFHNKEPNAVMSFCNYLHFNKDNDYLGDCFSYWPRFKKHISNNFCSEYKLLNNCTADIFSENIIGTSGVMINKAALNQDIYFDEGLSSAEDWDYWLKISLHGPVGFTHNIDLAYLMRTGSETSNIKLRLTQMQKIMFRHASKIIKTKPIALLQCVSRIFTGYGEYYRNLVIKQPSSFCESMNNFRPFLCHMVAFLLSPSWRSFNATVADIHLSEVNLYPFRVAKCKKSSKLQN